MMNFRKTVIVVGFVCLIAAASVFAFYKRESAHSIVTIDATNPFAAPQPLSFPVGATSPTGHILSANQRYLTLDDKPWFPIMGEFHYSRYPEDQWEQEILKMKAGGIQVISTYIFWIHHEEIQGQFDWRGQRDLRHFVELCGKHGMYVWIRIGPWDHGEVRNGGLPDWVVQTSTPRENDPAFLKYVHSFYNEIGKQVHGLFWQDGGPIIGVQLENEYSARGPGKGEDYIFQLLKMAHSAGINAPFYTVTGWDNAVIPSHDVLLVFSGYPDGFWWRSTQDRPPSPNYFFTKIRCDENVADDLSSQRPDIDAMDSHFPFLTAEMGGGMEVAYHRRPVMSADDTAAMELVKLGSGVALYGYYMFHGGTNPDGKKTTLQESQATGYPNDVPVKTYDFQAPLGEFGQMNPSYKMLKTFHLFLADFGEDLAPMSSYFPDRLPTSKEDTTTPRVAARLQDDHGFLFINNYEHIYSLSPKKNLQVKLKLPSTAVKIPDHPIDIPSGSYMMWPVNLNLGAVKLRYATAQLLCKIGDPQTYVFFAWPGIAPEFAIEEKDGISVESANAKITHRNGIAYIHQIEPGTQIAARVRQQNGNEVNIIVLSREEALNIWKANLAGKERLLLSSAQLYFDQDQIHISTTDDSAMQVGVFPAFDHDPAGFTSASNDGVFKTYSTPIQSTSLVAELHKSQDLGADPPVKMGKEVAMAPDASAYDTAAKWTIDVPSTPVHSRVFLKINYVGDVARIYSHGKLLTDNFYNGNPWIVGLDSPTVNKPEQLEVKILPLHEHPPIYLPKDAIPTFPPSGLVADIQKVQVLIEHDAVMDLKP